MINYLITGTLQEEEKEKGVKSLLNEMLVENSSGLKETWTSRYKELRESNIDTTSKGLLQGILL